MSNSGERRCGWRALAVIAIVACSPDASTGPQTGSESHFLVHCDGECVDGLSCLCGACTLACSGDEECTALHPAARCHAVAERPPAAACTNCDQAAFCDVACESDGDCAQLSPRHACDRGFCRAPLQAGLGANGAIALEELCDFYMRDVCEITIGCWDYEYRDWDHCLAAQECRGEALVRAAITDGRVHYDAAATYRCHRLLIENPCMLGFFFSIPSLDQALLRCNAVLAGLAEYTGEGHSKPTATGTVPEGQACELDVECAPGSECVTDLACPGTCLLQLGQGQACGADGQPGCHDGLLCNDGVCAPDSALGEPCLHVDDCQHELWCDQAVGLCVARAQAGEPCTSSGLGDAPDCDEELWCDADSSTVIGTCHPLSAAAGGCVDDEDCQEGLSCLPPVATGALGACAVPLPAGGACNSNLDCGPDLWCDSLMCAALPGAGQVCDSVCADGLLCDMNVCIPKLYPGEACDPEAIGCRNSTCRDATCQIRARVGEPCTDDDHCISFACAGAVCIDDTGCAGVGADASADGLRISVGADTELPAAD